MNVDRWLGVLGLIGTVLSLALAYYFYVKSIRTKVLAIAYAGPISLLPATPDTPNLRHLYRDKEVTKLSRVLVLFWNKGTAPIESTDFIAPIEVQPRESIVGLRIVEKDPAASVTVDEAAMRISIGLLRPGEAVIFEVDAAKDAFKPSIPISMKSSDMSRFLRVPGFFFPVLAAILTSGLIWMATGYDVGSRLISVLEQMYGDTPAAVWGPVFLFTLGIMLYSAAAMGIGLLVGWIVKRIYMSRSGSASRFFDMQMKMMGVRSAWKQMRKATSRLVD
jgi:hypothetical protein